MVSNLNPDAIAIVGMSCRFAGANNTDEFWQLLADGRDTVDKLPAERPNTTKGGHLESGSSVEGGFLKCPVDLFDSRFFEISPREAEFMDPQQRLLLEVIWEALEHAGIPPGALRATDTGSFLGIWQQDYDKFIAQTPHRSSTSGSAAGFKFTNSETHYRLLGNTFSGTGARIAHFLGLHGPSLAVESGCSSSLAALQMACEALRRGEISLAISSGVNLVLQANEPERVTVVSPAALSPRYRCRAFDSSADGYVRSEGVGTVILKRVGDAVRDGDNILAVVRGWAMNHDGAGTKFGRPNGMAQEAVVRAALKHAGVSAQQVSYVEAHGTGTRVGDPTELAALRRVYSEGRRSSGQKPALYLGSVKTNIGHTESAAGIAGLIKTVLAMQHGQIPAHLHLNQMSKQMQADLEAIPAIIPSQLTQWPASGEACTRRLAGVNCFSITGMNIHILLEEAPGNPRTPMHAAAAENSHQASLISLSAKSEASLKTLAGAFTEYLTANPATSLQDLAYTTNVCRAHNFPHRIAVVASDLQGLVTKLKSQSASAARASLTKPRIGFLFTGQGSQYIGMGQGLLRTSPPFAAAFRQCNELFATWLGIGLDVALWDKARSCLHDTLLCQPAIFCLQICLFRHWTALGAWPDLVLGHSVGEFAAAVAAGVLNLDEAFELIVERARLVATLPTDLSGMLVVHCNKEKVVQLLTSSSDLDVAAINSPNEVVLSGSKSGIAQLEQSCASAGIKSQRLSITHAYHSRAMDPILTEFEQVVRQVTQSRRSGVNLNGRSAAAMNCEYISATKSRKMSMEELLDSAYWVDHLRHTVNYSDAIKLVIDSTNLPTAAAVRPSILLEIGPQQTLLALTLSNLPPAAETKNLVLCSSLRQRRSSDWDVVLETAGILYCNGVDLNWRSMHQHGKDDRKQMLPSAPFYQFDRQRYWLESRRDDEQQEQNENNTVLSFVPVPGHPVFGRRVPCALPQFTLYNQAISTTAVPFLADHVVGGRVILPGAMYVEAALALRRKRLGVGGGGPESIYNVSIKAALDVGGSLPVHLQTLVVPQESNNAQDGRDFEISFHRLMHEPDNWKLHATVTFSATQDADDKQKPSPLNIELVKATLSKQGGSRSTTRVYESLAATGLQFGANFKSIKSVWAANTDDAEILAIIPVPASWLNDGTTTSYVCHPILIDAMLQTFVLGQVLGKRNSNENKERDGGKPLWLPVAIRKFTWFGGLQHVAAPGEELCVHHHGDIATLYDGNGQPLATIQGVGLIRVCVDDLARALDVSAVTENQIPDFYEEKWTLMRGGQPAQHQITERVKLGPGLATRIALNAVQQDLSQLSIAWRQTNLLCVFHILSCIQECNWTWPATGSMLSPDLWADCRVQQLCKTRIHLGFIGVLIQEGYLLQCEEAQSMYRVLRPLPILAKCQAQIRALRAQLPRLTSLDPRFYEFCLHCTENLLPMLQGRKTAQEVLFPPVNESCEVQVVGVSRFYQESKWCTMQSDMALATFKDLVTEILPENPSGLDRSKQIKEEGPRKILRILEVGAGTGDASGRLINYLLEAGGEFEYSFTDISQQFLDEAREKFANVKEQMRFGIFNAELDPLTQGYCPHQYDLVFAFHVLHATASLETTLHNLHMLLRPNGILLAMEMFRPDAFLNVTFALLDSWWRCDDGFRVTTPIVSPQEWTRLLEQTGFTHVETIQAHESAGLILARRAGSVVAQTNATITTPRSTPHKKTWILFSDQQSSSTLNHRLGSRMQVALDRDVIQITAGAVDRGVAQKSPNEYEIRFTDTEEFRQLFSSILSTSASLQVEGFLYNCAGGAGEEDAQITEADQRRTLSGLVHLLQNLTRPEWNFPQFKPKIVVLTRGAVTAAMESHDSSPRHATVWGAFRSFINEAREFEHCRVVDLDPDQQQEDDNSEVDQVCSELWKMDADKFVAIRAGKKYVQRLSRIDEGQAHPVLSLPIDTEQYKFDNPASGSISDIAISSGTTRSFTSNPRGHMVKIAVRAVGLNFRDLLCILKSDAFVQQFQELSMDVDVGVDVSGVVLAVGEAVTRFKPGDAVMGFCGAGGGISSHASVHETCVMKKPDQITFPSAASLPCIFLTSHVCLLNLAKLNGQDRVLIHVATGGVGLSAIQIAKRVGAQIYATAGTKWKRAYLRHHLGLQHVYNSRTLDYGPAILRDTNGMGVTVVLNSLTSSGFKETTLSCCARGATWLEIAVMNIWGSEEVAKQQQRPDVKYHVFNLTSTEPTFMQVIQEASRVLQAQFEDATYKPLPCTVFALERLCDAFNFFQQTKHIGKVVVKMPRTIVLDAGLKPSPALNQHLVLKHELFNAESAYLITGAYGGLGLEIVKWMSRVGAKHLVLVGTSPPSLHATQTLDEISKMSGCELMREQADVGDYAQCRKLLDVIAGTRAPLRGIFHAAGVLADGLLQNQTWNKFRLVFQPKVFGAWWLHKLTLDYDLEFFTMFSSVAALLGPMGQSGYAAACRFQDSLAHYRVSRGLPAASINWGVWGQVGSAAFLGPKGFSGIHAFTPASGIRALEEFMLRNYTQACVAHVPEWSTVQHDLNLGALLEDLVSDGTRDGGNGAAPSMAQLKQAMIAEILDCPPTVALKQGKVQIYLDFVLRETLRLAPTFKIDLDQNLNELGIDSLMLVMIRNRAQEIFDSMDNNEPCKKGLSLSVLDMQDNSTLRHLSTYVTNLLTNNGS